MYGITLELLILIKISHAAAIETYFGSMYSII